MTHEQSRVQWRMLGTVLTVAGLAIALWSRSLDRRTPSEACTAVA